MDTHDAHPGLRLTRDGDVLWITLDRAERQHRIDHDTGRQLIDTLREADLNHDVRAIVVTATGTSFFCTGADFTPSEVAPTGSDASNARRTVERPPLIDARRSVALFHDLYRTYWELETPVVAAVNGTVAGAGLPLAFGADLVIASSSARFRSIWSEGGMSAHAMDPYILPRVFPLHRLTEFAFVRRSFTAEELLGWQVLNRVVATDQLDAVAAELAAHLAAGPTISMGQTKRLYRRSLDSDLATSLAEEAAAIVMLSPSTDRKEGMRALAEGRRAEFTGR